VARRTTSKVPPLRPVWVIAAVVVAGAALCAFVIAYADYVYGYFFILTAGLIGIASAAFAALVTDRLAWRNRLAIALAGLTLAVATYGMIWVFAYMLRVDTLPAGMGLLDYVAVRLDSVNLARYGRELFSVSSIWAVGIWLAEFAILIYCALAMTPKLHDVFRAHPNPEK